MKRREFFQETSHLLTLLGASWLGGGKSALSNPLLVREPKAILAGKGQKLALLVGIDKYSSPLAGCVTDVELQKELLIYRFGFQESDILTLTDDRATRSQIEAAFAEHLGDRVGADDTVVFHFSGYGTQIPIAGKAQNALVTLEAEGIGYLDWDSLQRLIRSLRTQKILTILDTSFSLEQAQSLPNLRWRTLPETTGAKTISNLALPGILVQATNNGLAAGERNWGGFTAGMLTYNLTQQLWARTDLATVTFQKTTAEIDEAIGKWQQPSIDLDRNRYHYAIESNNLSGAEGAIFALDERPNYVKIWLGGLPTSLMANYGVNSLFTTAPEPPYAPLIVQIKSKEGAIAKAKTRSVGEIDSSVIGQQLQELIRVIPHQISLNIGLNPELERIERVDATSALANVPAVSVIGNSGSQSADYWFGKVIQTQKTGEVADSYGLFTLTGDSLLGTLGEGNEAIKLAANRLRQPLNQLLAGKIWQMMENQTTSRLGLKVTLETADNNSKVIAEKQTQRSSLSNQQSVTFNSRVPELAPQTSLRYKIENLSDRPIYWLLVGISTDRNPIVWEAATEAIAPKSTCIVPEPSTNLLWLSKPAPGIAQIYLIACIAPLEKAIAAIQSQTKGKGLVGLPEPLAVAQAVLADLHQASTLQLAANPLAISPETLSAISDSYFLEVNSWATLKFSYRCI